MDNSSVAPTKSHTRKLGHGSEKGKLKRKTESLLIESKK